MRLNEDTDIVTLVVRNDAGQELERVDVNDSAMDLVKGIKALYDKYGDNVDVEMRRTFEATLVGGGPIFSGVIKV